MEKIAIFALTRGYLNISDYSALIQRNISIKSNLSPVMLDSVELLLFHEGKIGLDQQSEIQRLSNCAVKFISIADSYQNWNDSNPYNEYIGAKDSFLVKATTRDMDTGIPWSTGYRNMCHFYALLSVVILGRLGYSHALRIDEDCIITSSLDQIFHEISNHPDSLIGTPAMFEESHKLTNTILPNFLRLTQLNYVQDWQEKYGANSPMVYSNVNLYYIDNILKNPSCVHFYKILNESGVIHRCRLGDAPLLFWLSQLKSNSLNIINHLNYTHLSHQMSVAGGKVSQ